MKKLSQMLLAGCIIFTILSTEAEAADFEVVVNSNNQMSSISKKDLSRIYLKRTVKWPDGRSVEIVDQSNKNKVHEDFVQEILGRDSAWVENHWQKMVFSGRGSAPPVKKSDTDVLEFVRNNAGAIGYISGDAEIGPGVKALDVK